ncbi:MAG: hypothetical protein GF350_05060, partial [Chitinivibrionales bacterium]|nr:hypothetical protein [Chitinivibrionales bacterium]
TLFHIGDRFPEFASLVPEKTLFRKETVLSRSGKTPDEIVRKASDLNADLIVMPTNGRDTFAQKIVGSITEQVLHRTSCPVLAVAV